MILTCSSILFREFLSRFLIISNYLHQYLNVKVRTKMILVFFRNQSRYLMYPLSTRHQIDFSCFHHHQVKNRFQKNPELKSDGKFVCFKLKIGNLCNLNYWHRSRSFSIIFRHLFFNIIYCLFSLIFFYQSYKIAF